MFQWINNKVIGFCLQEEGEGLIKVENWDKYVDKYLSQYSIIKELIDNNIYEADDYFVYPPLASVLSLSINDKGILNLPDPYPFVIYLESESTLNSQDFKIKYRFLKSHPLGELLAEKREGAFIKIKNNYYLLNLEQYLLLEAIDKFNELDSNEKSFNNNLLKFSEIKGLATKAKCELEDYLKNEDVLTIDKIKIDIENNNDEIKIIPKIPNLDEDNFVKKLELFPTVKETYTINDKSNKKYRFVLKPEQKKALEKVKRKRFYKSNEEIRALIENPLNEFDDEVFDLEVFYSERVKEIGIYKPRYYPFIQPYKSEWIPGFIIKDKFDGEKRVVIDTIEKLNEFKEKLEEAEKTNKNYVKYEDEEIPLDEARTIIKVAEKQLANPKRQLDIDDETLKKEVLIIKENAEILEYSEFTDQNITSTQKFEEITNLKRHIALKNHQKEGVTWLQFLYGKVKGCLLADDMGLGKTLQVLYFIEWHCQKFIDNKPYIIIAPLTLLENWEIEYFKFFNPTNLKIFNLRHENKYVKDNFDPKFAEELNKKQIILTNYETFKKYQLTLCAIDYSVVVVDEAQKIKTPGTIITNTVKAVKADFKIALTGTPIENSLMDLWCIMDFAIPGLLGNAKDFAKKYQNPLRSTEEIIVSISEKLRKEIGIFLKRRIKDDVLKDLPIKHDNEKSKIKRKMPNVQLNVYIDTVDSIKKELKDNNEKEVILEIIHKLKDISDHPYLVEHDIDKFNVDELIANSAKLQIVIDLLRDIKLKGEKVIIFAERKKTQKMLQKVIAAKFHNMPSIINGDTPSYSTERDGKISRQQAINRFQAKEGFNVIIMSPLAAGVGLTVTAANHVIHYSRHWNPAKEMQATDRAYRIGQDKEVYIYYPMAVSDKFDTFDVVLDNLLAKKRKLATNVLFPIEGTEVRPDEVIKGLLNSNNNYTNISNN